MSNSPAATATPSATAVTWWQVMLAFVWLVVFAGCFYQFDFPNSNPRHNRGEIWQQLPSLLINTVDPSEPSVRDFEARQLWKSAGWRYWPQRFGLYAVAIVILAGAWAWGSVSLRLLRLPLAAEMSLERIFFAFAVGLSLVSLITLGAGLSGCLSRSLLGSTLAVGVLIELGCWVRLKGNSTHIADVHEQASFRDHLNSSSPHLWPLWLILPFVFCYVGGAFLPETDFDVKEYHFGGPKEWYLAGTISFLPHNVYTSFPFLTEMLTLQGMVLYGDWYWGAIAAKGVLLSFAPLTALGLFIAGRRWFSPRAGAWAAVIHLSTPWIYRISIIAYAEGGLTFYLFAALLALMLWIERNSTAGVSTAINSHKWGWILLAGFLAGSAMACKYTGAVSVVIPLGVMLTIHASRTVGWALLPVPSAASKEDGQECPSYKRAATLRTACGFSLGVALAVGPWLLKNLIETGNPVYPLMYGVFGGVDWNAELDAKFKHAHSPDNFHLGDLGVKFIDVTLKSDWLSPLLFGLAPLAFMLGTVDQRRRVAVLWIYVAYLFGTWWLCTHRLDRFWVPLIPVVSLLAGVGATWCDWRVWRIGVASAVVCAVTYNFAFMTSSLCGYNAYLLDLNRAADQTARLTAPEVVLLNSSLPPGSKVLCVGEAELFDARFDYTYNTVFDKCLFEEWCGVEDPEIKSADRPLKSPAEIRQKLKDQGITHIFVNWREILRYRLTYGYTDFVTPIRFQQMQPAGILGPSWQAPDGQLFEDMPADSRREIQRWGPELIHKESGAAFFQTFDVFPVLP